MYKKLYFLYKMYIVIDNESLLSEVRRHDRICPWLLGLGFVMTAIIMKVCHDFVIRRMQK